jgi:hypothetical protein
MGKKSRGRKLKRDFVAGPLEISKYKRIRDIQFVPGRPGEEYYEVTDEDGRTYQLSPDQKRHLEELLAP